MVPHIFPSLKTKFWSVVSFKNLYIQKGIVSELLNHKTTALVICIYFLFLVSSSPSLLCFTYWDVYIFFIPAHDLLFFANRVIITTSCRKRQQKRETDMWPVLSNVSRTHSIWHLQRSCPRNRLWTFLFFTSLILYQNIWLSCKATGWKATKLEIHEMN